MVGFVQRNKALRMSRRSKDLRGLIDRYYLVCRRMEHQEGSPEGLNRLIHATYDLMGLFSFSTAGDPEVRAWTIRKGATALKAAGEIHSDIERGFIRAEVVNCDDLLAAGSIATARDKGQVRLEGKEYIVHDGDVILFRHSG